MVDKNRENSGNASTDAVESAAASVHDDLLEHGSVRRSRAPAVVGHPVGPRGWCFLRVYRQRHAGGAYFLEVDEVVAADLPSSRPIRVKGKVVVGTYRPEG